MDNSISQLAAIIASLILFGLAIFQLLLAVGKPYGEYAWGGQHKILPKSLRVGSILSIGIYTLFSIILIDSSSLIDIIPEGIIKLYAIWFLVIYLAIGVFVNAISKSKKERSTMTPIIIVLLFCALTISLV